MQKGRDETPFQCCATMVMVEDGNILVVEDGNVVVVEEGGEMQKGRDENSFSMLCLQW